MNRRVVLLVAAGAVVVLTSALLTAGVAAQVGRKMSSGSPSERIASALLDLPEAADITVATGAAAVDLAADVVAEPGAVVIGLVRDGPASKAGIVRGDVLLRADNSDVNDAHDLAVAMAPHGPGEVLAIRLRHGDEERTLEVTLGDLDGSPQLGVVVHPGGAGEAGFAIGGCLDGLPGVRVPFGLALGHLEGLDLPEGVDRAAVIGSVVPDSPAAKAGLEDGDLVTAIDGKPVASGDALVDAVAVRKPGDAVVLTIARPGEDSTRELTVTLGAKPGEPEKAYLGVNGIGVFVLDEGPAGAVLGGIRKLELKRWLPGGGASESPAATGKGDTM